MISFNEIERFFPDTIRGKPQYYEYLLKEYFHYRMLDIIFNSKWADKLSFIGGTSIRILHHIERFSEDLDFDSFQLSREEFLELTDEVIRRLRQEGIEVFADDKEKDLKLHAFRRNVSFPGLMYKMGLSGHRKKRFLIKIESEPHHFQYDPDKPVIQKFNILTQINSAPMDILLAMKIGAVIERKKGRDYYDCMYLMGISDPNWDYLAFRFGINSPDELNRKLLESCRGVDFNQKSKEFERLVFNFREAKKVHLFSEYIRHKKYERFQ